MGRAPKALEAVAEDGDLNTLDVTSRAIREESDAFRAFVGLTCRISLPMIRRFGFLDTPDRGTSACGRKRGIHARSSRPHFDCRPRVRLHRWKLASGAAQ